MKPEELESLKSGDLNRTKAALCAFAQKYANLFDFREFNAKGQWIVIWDAVFNILRNEKYTEVFPDALCCVRILARDENNIRRNNIRKDFDCLLKLANLAPESLTGTKMSSSEVTVEALKCLCNMVYLSVDCQKACLRNSSTDGIIKRVSCDKVYSHDIEYFDMKLLFLITALESGTRNKVRDDLNGLTYLTEWLDLKVKEKDKSDKEIDLIWEILKVLFNITANNEKTSIENEILYRRLTAVARALLLEFGDLTGEKEKNAVTSTIHLLTNVPTVCMVELMQGSTGKSDLNKENLFEGKCVKALDVLLQYLKNTLNNENDKSPSNLLHETLPPILTVLVKCARSNSTMRHYIRSVILPPLKDVSRRPEEGNELRNHLCRFLTLPQMTIRGLASDLLFVLCKENVGRMIKYTGYGNAAGLFASRGVLDGRKTDNTEYSSDSEDSDTEEYKKMQHGINPVLGCYEAPKPNPLEGMSEEQKEYEAIQLANLMEKLHRQGVVQPCRIGEDGKPQPVDHILQLQEELPQQQIDQKRKT